jgi:hypothetical protein
MTRRLLFVLGSPHGRWSIQLMVLMVVVALLPWAVLIDLARWGWRRWRIARLLGAETVRCPRGHTVVLVAPGWQCHTCGFVYSGSGFHSCPQCGTVAAYVSCACGCSVPNPLFELVQS